MKIKTNKDLIENKKIFQIIKERINTPKSEYITLNNLVKKLKINLDRI